ncbi:MAG: GDP-L-fucose synthase [Rhodospirillaceae bacterium]
MSSAYELSRKRVWVAGHRGMVGSALVRRLGAEDCDILTVGREAVDLTRQADVENWLAEAKPHVIFLAAARVGGIHANNTRPAEFLYDNLVIETNIIEAARRVGVEKLLFLGSSCIYPREAPQPISEGALLTGPLEPTNEWYAIAKIAGIKLCQAYRQQYSCDFISAQPTNLYGPGDNFDLTSSHVLPALIAKAHAARMANQSALTVWGSGRPLREFLHVDDLADACIHLMTRYSGATPVNVGSGEEVSIRDLAALVNEVVGFRGHLEFDRSKPDGTPRKKLDTSRMEALGWRATIPLREGIAATYAWYQQNQAETAA